MKLPESSENTLVKLLSDMVKRGLLMRLKKGVYCVIPYEEDPEHLRASLIFKGGTVLKKVIISRQCDPHVSGVIVPL